jgi:4a-hydroxytetrahydrobiopterin dehydratase
MERKKLSADEIEGGLAELEGWRTEDGKLLKSFKFANFAESLDFVNKTGEIAERHDHHPDITFGWGYADLVITTHSEGGITGMDLALAKEIDGSDSP